MKKEVLDRLLAKYYSGKSTDEEEEMLRVFFAAGNVPPEYEADNDVFRYYVNSVEVPEPSADFEARIFEGIDKEERSERKGAVKRYIIPFLSAAATLAVLTVSYLLIQKNAGPRDTYTDPKIAYAETMKILMNVSTQINRGVSELEPVSKISEVTAMTFQPIAKTTKIVEQNLQQLDYLNRALEFTGTSDMTRINKK